jgi:hypothetical protein
VKPRLISCTCNGDVVGYIVGQWADCACISISGTVRYVPSHCINAVYASMTQADGWQYSPCSHITLHCATYFPSFRQLLHLMGRKKCSLSTTLNLQVYHPRCVLCKWYVNICICFSSLLLITYWPEDCQSRPKHVIIVDVINYVTQTVVFWQTYPPSFTTLKLKIRKKIYFTYSKNRLCLMTFHDLHTYSRKCPFHAWGHDMPCCFML